MEIQLINEELLAELRGKAKESERKRTNFDLRNTPEDTSQRMLNVMEVGTFIPVHRHLDSSETFVCIKGKMDVVFYEETPDSVVGESLQGGQEVRRVRVCPADGVYGVQIPKAAWHTVEVLEPTVIIGVMDGRYQGK